MGENSEITSNSYLSLLEVQTVEMQLTLNRRRRGLVRIGVMKNLNVLKAHLNLQAHSKNLKLNVKIGLSEQGKVLSVSKPTKKISG